MTERGSSLSRRDFLRLRRSERGKIVELSCRTLFMRSADGATARVEPPPDADVHALEPWMGEPEARLERRSASDLIDATEEELRDAQVLRLVDPEWLDAIDGAARLEAVIEGFRARGGVVERARALM